MDTHLRVLIKSYLMNTNMTVQMGFNNLCILVLWMKLASALEGLEKHAHIYLSLKYEEKTWVGSPIWKYSRDSNQSMHTEVNRNWWHSSKYQICILNLLPIYCQFIYRIGVCSSEIWSFKFTRHASLKYTVFVTIDISMLLP